MTQVGRADPPLAVALEEARVLAGAQVRHRERLNGLYFEGVPEYPEFAWQEALVNVIAHRDYEVWAARLKSGSTTTVSRPPIRET